MNGDVDAAPVPMARVADAGAALRPSSIECHYDSLVVWVS